jgi:hypothetical protein
MVKGLFYKRSLLGIDFVRAIAFWGGERTILCWMKFSRSIDWIDERKPNFFCGQYLEIKNW